MSTRTRPRFALALVLALAALLPAAAASAGDLGPLEPLADLHRAVRESLGLPEPLIVQLLERGAPDEHLPVLGFLARELGQTPERIHELHHSGVSFLDIALRFGKGPELFHVPFERDPGPPYGKAWGHYRDTPRSRWSRIRLDDQEIVELVNLRVASDYYSVPIDRIVALRKSGRGFGGIHHQLTEDAGRPHAARVRADTKDRDGHRGKGKGKRKDKEKDEDRH